MPSAPPAPPPPVTLGVADPERDRLAQQVADSHAMLDGVFADAPVGLAFFDRQLRYVRINAELAAMNGLPVEAHLGKRLEEILPELADAVNPLFQRVLDSGEPIRGIAVVDARPPERGGPRHWRASYFPVRAGGRPDAEIIAVGVAAEEITDQVRAAATRDFLFTLGAVLQSGTLTRDPRGIAREGARLLAEQLGADRVVWMVLDPDLPPEDGPVLVPLAQHVRAGPAIADDARFAMPTIGDAVVQEMWEETPLVIDDVCAHPATAAAPDVFLATGTRAIVSVGLRRAGAVVASLSVTVGAPRAWAPHEVAIVRAAAERLWPAVETARALRAEQRARARAERLQAFTAALASSVTRDDVVARLVEEGRATLGAAAAAVVLPCADDEAAGAEAPDAVARVRWVGVVHSVGYAPERIGAFARFPIRTADGGTPSPDQDTPVGVAMRTGAPVYLATLDAAVARFPGTAAFMRASEYGAWLALPLVADAGGPAARVVGGLGIAFAEPHRLDGEERRLLETISRQAAQALDRVRLAEAERRARAEAEAARAAAERERESATEANRAKSQFLATMSHELRTPLNAIQGHVQLVELGLHGPITEAQREALGRVGRAQRHLLGLIDQVLNLSRIETGRMEYRIEPLPLRRIAEEALALVDAQARRRPLALTMDVDEALVVRTDADRLRQVLVNLLGNAVKFTPPGGRVHLGAAPRDGGRLVAVDVVDSGIGIPPEQQAAIFEPFVRVDSRLARSTEGAGLGLAIAREMVREMGGEVSVRSVVGEGATFTVVLPGVE